jgi:hypothetical protein
MLCLRSSVQEAYTPVSRTVVYSSIGVCCWCLLSQAWCVLSMRVVCSRSDHQGLLLLQVTVSLKSRNWRLVHTIHAATTSFFSIHGLQCDRVWKGVSFCICSFKSRIIEAHKCSREFRLNTMCLLSFHFCIRYSRELITAFVLMLDLTCSKLCPTRSSSFDRCTCYDVCSGRLTLLRWISATVLPICRYSSRPWYYMGQLRIRLCVMTFLSFRLSVHNIQFRIIV